METGSPPGQFDTSAQTESGARGWPDRDHAGELLANGSIELSIGDRDEISSASQSLPYGMRVSLPLPPKRDLLENLSLVRDVSAAGFDPVPHLAARNIDSRDDLLAFLEQAVAEFGVHRVLLIGGDREPAAGPFGSSAELLADGILSDSGITEISVAGYPEGHWKIPEQALRDDLRKKVGLARSQGLGIEIVTQFCFAPHKIIEYCGHLDRDYAEVPVYVGMVGPTNLRSLIRFARHCGVSTTLFAMENKGMSASKFLRHAEPTDQLMAVAHYCAARVACNVIGVHLFSFGGFRKTAEWMRDQLRTTTSKQQR